MNRVIKVYNLGRISFDEAWKIQKKIARRHLDAMTATRSSSEKRNDEAAGEDVLLLLEHDPPVYTIGIRRKDYSADEERRLVDLGAQFVRTDRGGLITFHGPGQLVAYPVLNLSHYRKSVRWYVRQLERAVIETCGRFDVTADTSLDTGVWVGEDKIAAIGIHGSRFVTTHGVALNCDVDLTWFDHIVPCGIPDKGVTSLSKQLDKRITVGEAMPAFLHAFQRQFDCRFDHETNLFLKTDRLIQ